MKQPRCTSLGPRGVQCSQPADHEGNHSAYAFTWESSADHTGANLRHDRLSVDNDARSVEQLQNRQST